jgi:hypothetical protein
VAHLTREDPWGTTDLDLVHGHVFVRQDWRYEWLTSAGAPPWTASEKVAYHHAVDHLVWAYWSFRARIHVSASGRHGSSMAQDVIARFQARGLTLSFDVRAVDGPAQWRAVVTKVDPRARPLPTASVWFEARKLELFSIDVFPHDASRFRGDRVKRPNFSVTAHEFGHTLGYVYGRGDGEEHDRGHPFFEDVQSIMNVGRTVRPRHLRLTLETLEKMIPGCRFTATVS